MKRGPRDVCPVCGTHTLVRDRTIKHPPMSNPFGAKRYRCQRCGGLFSTNEARYLTGTERIAEREREKCESDPGCLERKRKASRESHRRSSEQAKRDRAEEHRRAFAILAKNDYTPKERTKTMTEHQPVRSTDLSALQGIFFEELDNLMALGEHATEEEVQREIDRAKAVSEIGGRAIENANTVCNILRTRADLGGAKLSSVPKMLE